jgi:hypothetical protein
MFGFRKSIFFTEQGRQPCIQSHTTPNLEGQVSVFMSSVALSSQPGGPNLCIYVVSCTQLPTWRARSPYSCHLHSAPNLEGQVSVFMSSFALSSQPGGPGLCIYVVSCTQLPTWRARFLYLCPPVTGWHSYTPGHRVPLPSPSTTC